MLRFFFVLILILAACFGEGCSHNKQDKLVMVQKVYNDRTNLIRIFQNKSILRRGNMTVLRIHFRNKENEFFFENFDTNTNSQTKRYRLKRYEVNDTLAMNSPEGLPAKILSDTFQARKPLESLIKGYSDTMIGYSIREITSEFTSQGIDLKFYLEGNIVILYVKDPSQLNNSWRGYIMNAKKLDDNWYYYLAELSQN